jgi:uncharacterized membrane protein YuzA (DUF378 family)
MSPHVTTERRHIPDRRANSMSMAQPRMKAFEWIPMVLLIIGGVNWGLVGLFNIDVVATLFGTGSALTRIIYVLVGLSALYSIYLSTKMSSKQTSAS